MIRVGGNEIRMWLPKKPRGYTYVVATSDASDREKTQADSGLILPGGGNDAPILNALWASLVNGMSIKVLGRNISLGATGLIYTGRDAITYHANGITHTYTGAGDAMTLAGITTNSHFDVNTGIINCTGAANSALRLSSFTNSLLKAHLNNLNGAALLFDVGAGQCEANNFDLYMVSKYGISTTAGVWSLYYNYFTKIAWTGWDVANAICIDSANYTGAIMGGWEIDQLVIWIFQDLVQYGLNDNNMNNIHIDNLHLDGQGGHGNGFVLFQNTVDTIKADIVHNLWCHANLAYYGGTATSKIGNIVVNAPVTLPNYYRDGIYNHHMIMGSGAVDTATGVAGRVHLVALTVKPSDGVVLIDRIRVALGAVTAGNITLGMYKDNGGTPAGGALVATTASIASPGSIANFATLALGILPPGQYWMAFECSDATQSAMRNGGYFSGGGVPFSYYFDQAYGALPAICPAVNARADSSYWVWPAKN